MFDTNAAHLGGPAKREPSAEVRHGMAQIHELYIGMLDAGFDQGTARAMLLEMLRESIRAGDVCPHCGKRPTDA